MTPVPPRYPALFLLTSHWVGLLGVALVTTAGCSWLFVLPLHMRGSASNPYIGLLIFFGIPVVFFAGLALMPLGMFFARRRVAAGLAALSDRRTLMRRLAVFLAVMTTVNVVIGSQITYRAVEHMDTNQFCGQSCHVMKPEFTAHQTGPHQKVACVDCHITPGATGWMRAKIAGTRQLKDVVFNSYPRPIPSAMESNRLSPSVETCEQCHARERNSGSKLLILTEFNADAANTPTKTVLMMHVGGANSGGIHGAHLGPGVEIRYAAADAKRQVIPWVEYRNSRTGEAKTWLAGGTSAAAIAPMAHFEMQCVDCHNRPAHSLELPEEAVDHALTAGGISAALPFAKKTAVEILKASYPNEDAALKGIPAAFSSFYRQNYPGAGADEIARGAQAVSGIYQDNVFPDLKVTWGTYVNNLGHTSAPGCFRCHDDGHTAVSAKAGVKTTLTQDCSVCHNVLAVQETSPQILKGLGVQ